ncbi:MAG TPA: restriction endonuclease [Spirochaetota bacterium]|nr:restriction endonuclease [Spirochaetota bacterium]HPS86973.1 restriction endonuclease [Spirochaetota bacterium]
MLVPLLITAIIILGAIVFYLYYLAPKLNPKNKAEILLGEDRVDEAIVEFKKVLEKLPYEVSIHWRLAGLYLNQDKIDLAVNHLEAITDINRYNAFVEKGDVYKLLADLYLQRGDKLKAFEKFYELLKEYPSDAEALYHVGFMSLGQEIFETAYRNLETLSRLKKKNFEVLFGAGIAALQTQRATESVGLFKEALSLQPDSDITNIAIAFALYRKKDFKSAVNYVKTIVDESKDENALFVAKRLLAFLYIETKKNAMAIKLFDELKEYCIQNDFDEELKIMLYDFGFANLIDDRKEEAYQILNQLYQKERNFRNVLDLVTRLRKEMDVKPGAKQDDHKPVVLEAESWKEKAFPDNYLWNICGLKSEEQMDLQSIISSGRPAGVREKRIYEDSDTPKESAASIEEMYKLDSESFRSISYRLCEKLGLVVDEIMTTYRESDGVDFMTTQKEGKIKTLVWVRRWKGANIGEIPLRNFAQAINDVKAKQGYFITTSPLSPAGESALKSLEKVKVVFPEALSAYLKGLL